MTTRRIPAAERMPIRMPAPNDGGVLRWFMPDEDLTGELVLSGNCGAALEQLARELKATTRFLEAGVDPSTRVLFSGPSGTGKTLAARWLGWTMRLPVACVDVALVVGSTLGATSQNIAKAVTLAKGSHGILFLDEIDAICAKRSDSDGGAADAELARATTTMLQQLDWLEPAHIVIAATNFPDVIDTALRRRLTTEITFETPTRDARRGMLERWLSRSPLADSLDELADGTEGMTGATLRSFAMARARERILELPEAPKKTARAQSVEGAQGLLAALEQSPAASRAS
jgi:SpoVK/Ycf46/Vps4 family AAA+-type ATPase